MTDTWLRPMLAANVEWPRVKYPMAVSPKIDGFRCMILEGVAYSRSGKPIRNAYFQLEVARYAAQLEGLDGELIIGDDPTARDLLRRSTSAFNSNGGTPEFSYWVFDTFQPQADPWRVRYDKLVERMLPPWAHVVPHLTCLNEAEVMGWEQAFVNDGFEGLMLRKPGAPYTFRRSTAEQGFLLKAKRFNDAEAEIIGVEELMHNENPAVISPQGLTTRQSLQEFKTGAGTLGSLRCRLPDGTEFGIGTGFSAADRDQMWIDREMLIGQPVTFKSMEYGAHEAPRFPVFKSLRSRDDL